jgi:hypothetical protein
MSKTLISKESYDKIRKSVDKWPQWKKDMCNRELIVSKNSRKI